MANEKTITKQKSNSMLRTATATAVLTLALSAPSLRGSTNDVAINVGMAANSLLHQVVNNDGVDRATQVSIERTAARLFEAVGQKEEAKLAYEFASKTEASDSGQTNVGDWNARLEAEGRGRFVAACLLIAGAGIVIYKGAFGRKTESKDTDTS